jgi:hypothetical protein
MRSLSLRLVSRFIPQPKEEREEDVKKEKSSGTVAPWIQILGWTSVATGALTVGFFVGRNIRARYLMNHRTPYDFYSHAGDNGHSIEYGVGV